MSDKTTQSGKRRKQSFDKNHSDYTGDNPRGIAKGKVAVAPPAAPAPITTKGQKYVAPPERHSRQTHRRAEERAAAQGHATEKEQHAHDRNLLVTEQNRLAEQQLKQQQRQQGNK